MDKETAMASDKLLGFLHVSADLGSRVASYPGSSGREKESLVSIARACA